MNKVKNIFASSVLLIATFVVLSVSAYASDFSNRLEMAKKQASAEMLTQYKTNEEKAKVSKLIDDFFDYSNKTIYEIERLKREQEKIDVSLVWEQKNFYDKVVLDKTLIEHKKFIDNLEATNKIYFKAKEDLMIKIKNSVLNAEHKKEFLEGLSEGFGEKGSLIIKRQDLYKDLVKINTQVISIIKRNFGKLSQQNGVYYFTNEIDLEEYNRLIPAYTIKRKEIDNVTKLLFEAERKN